MAYHVECPFDVLLIRLPCKLPLDVVQLIVSFLPLVGWSSAFNCSTFHQNARATAAAYWQNLSESYKDFSYLSCNFSDPGYQTAQRQFSEMQWDAAFFWHNSEKWQRLCYQLALRSPHAQTHAASCLRRHVFPFCRLLAWYGLPTPGCPIPLDLLRLFCQGPWPPCGFSKARRNELCICSHVFAAFLNIVLATIRFSADISPNFKHK